MYTVYYYKKLETGWIKGKVRNLSVQQAIEYVYQLGKLFDTPLVRAERQN